MSSCIHIIMILGIFTSCMQVTTKKKLDFNGSDSSANSQSNNDGPSTSSSSNNNTITHITEFIGPRSMNVRFGDYKFITAALKQKYGPACNSIIMNNIWNGPGIFGAVCDYYDRDHSCNNAKENTALALTSTMRAGRVMKTCEEIAMNRNCVSYFLQQAQLSASSAFTSMNILKVFKVFYPLTSGLTNKEEDAFMALGSQFTGTSDQWKAVSLALCVSPQWQIP